MSKFKVILIFLFLLGILPELESYNYMFIEPYERNYLTNYYKGAALKGRYGRSEFQCPDRPDSNKNCASSVGTGDPKKLAYGIAQKAALDAKAANDAQIGAAEAASQQVKAELAYKAEQSAKAAEAALAGKQQILDQMRLELADSESALRIIQEAMPKFGENADMLKSVSLKSEKQVAYMKKIVEIATAHLANDKKVAKGAQQEVVEKTALMNAAKQRSEIIHNRLSEATKDLDATKTAAYKASCAAVEAKQKAQRSRRDSWMYENLW
ncbi:hypothetical protein KR032_003897 [Drosophila birchii]|nr:hypothetical protein KR032_003897 [Drosophila birchii]